MSTCVIVSDIGGVPTSVSCDNIHELIPHIEEEIGTKFEYFDLVDECRNIHVTKSKKLFDSYDFNRDTVELRITVSSDTPVRITDNNVITSKDGALDIKRMEKKHGTIGDWDVSFVTNMKNWFMNSKEFNTYIGGWDTSSVTDMSCVFDGASSFNQDITEWDTSSVTDMCCMFADATSFNQAIGKWDTSHVTDMCNMFASAHSFNKDIGGWDTCVVTYMSHMFDDAKSFNQDISGWDTGRVTEMYSVFDGATSFNKIMYNPFNNHRHNRRRIA